MHPLVQDRRRLRPRLRLALRPHGCSIAEGAAEKVRSHALRMRMKDICVL